MAKKRKPRERLRAWRLEQGLSQREVGEVVSCAPITISHIETGDRHPGLRLAMELERVTGIPSVDWVTDR